MSLEDKIKNAKETMWPLENWQTFDNLDAFQFALTCVGDEAHAEDIRRAIEIMRKYEKARQIYFDYMDDADVFALANRLGEVF